jgi:hypothetical protein
MRYSILKKLAGELQKNSSSESQKINLLYLYLGEYAQVAGDTSSMLLYYHQVTVGTIFNLLRIKEFDNQITDQSFRMIAYAIEGLSAAGHFDEALAYIKMFKNPINRSSLYAFVGNELLKKRNTGNLTNRFLDSAKVELNRAENITQGQPNRQLYAQALIMQDPLKNESEAYRVIRNIPNKSFALSNICRAYAFHGELFKAQNDIPAFISDSDLAVFLWYFLYGYEEGNSVPGKAWNNFNSNYYSGSNLYIRYIDENS